MMVEDESDSSEFVWVNDARENGHGNAVVRGTVGLPSDPSSDDDSTTVQMELPDELADEIISLYDELDADFYQRYGERLEPNELFWENSVRVMLENADELREHIGIK
jgi:hypothetical protein